MTYVTLREPVRPLYRMTQVVWYVFNFIEALLLFRFVLKLLAANPSVAFTQIIYSITHPFVAPFIAVFRNTRFFGSTFEWTTLLAMFVYWLIAWAIVRLVLMAKPVSTYEADYRLSEQDSK